MGSSNRDRVKGKFNDLIPKTKGNGNGLGNNCWKGPRNHNEIRAMGSTISRFGSDSGKKNPPKRENNQKRNK